MEAKVNLRQMDSSVFNGIKKYDDVVGCLTRKDSAAHCKPWYKCSKCLKFLPSKEKYLLHVEDCHLDLRRTAELFFVSDKCGIPLNLLDSPQLFIPRITIRPLDEAYNDAEYIFPLSNVTLIQLSDQHVQSIKEDLQKRQLRPRLNREKSLYDSDCTSEYGNEIDPHRPVKKKKKKVLVQSEYSTTSKENPITSKYICHICGKRLRCDRSGKSHIASHSFTRCIICRKKLRGAEEADNHMAFHKAMEERRSRKTFECTVCHVKFMHKENLIRHFTKHTENNPFRCKICGRDSISKYHLQRHYAIHFDSEKLDCHFCGMKLSRPEGLRRHLKVHEESGDYFSRTKKVLQKKTRLERISSVGVYPTNGLIPSAKSQQITIDETTGKVKTEEVKTEDGIESTDPPLQTAEELMADLPDSWSRETVLKMKELKFEIGQGTRIYTTRGLPNSFTCKFCTVGSFSRFFALRIHMKHNHPKEFAKENEVKALTLICSSCGFTCASTDELSAHMETEHGNPITSEVQPQWFPCTMCGSRCKDQQGLDRHMALMHQPSVERKYACDGHCSKTFVKLVHLRQHERRFHVGEKDGPKVQCPKCGKEELSRKALAIHSRLHAPDRVLSVCHLCNERCSNIHSLRRHVHLVHGNGLYRRNKGKERKIQSGPISEDQLFL